MIAIKSQLGGHICNLTAKGGRCLDILLKEQIMNLLESICENDPKWKLGSDLKHLERRKRRKHIPNDFTIRYYNNLIMNILKDKENDIYIYFLEHFDQNYFVFGDGQWVVIVGENGIIETAMATKDERNYKNYLSEGKGYKYIGKIKEVY